MPTREQTIADAVRIFEGAGYPSGLTLETAWLGIYQTLMWYEPINLLDFTSLPHIIDADKLCPASPARKIKWKTPSIWQKRALLLSDYLVAQLGCSTEEAPQKVDLLMRQPAYEGMQAHNPRGIAFVGLIKHILEKFGSHSYSYQTEVEASSIFPGISVPGRSSTPRIDLLVRRDDIPQAIISAKWSLRHDRLSDITNECPVYKAAYERIYRQRNRRPLIFFVVTNEYDSSRLGKILGDSCVDGVAHVHKKAVVDVCGMGARLTDLMDLGDIVKATLSW